MKLIFGRSKANINFLVGKQNRLAQSVPEKKKRHPWITRKYTFLLKEHHPKTCVMIILLNKMYFVYIFIQEWIFSAEAEQTWMSVLSHKNTFPESQRRINVGHLIILHLTQPLRWLHNAKTLIKTTCKLSGLRDSSIHKNHHGSNRKCCIN